MCNWLEDAINFLFPEPVEVDMDGRPCASIPDSVGDHPVSAPASFDAHDALPEPPPMFRAEPAVLEAELVIQGKSTSRPITDGRVMK